MPSDQIAQPDETFAPVPFNPGLDEWEAAVSQGDTVTGADKSNAAQLQDVPFLITRATFRDGTQRKGVPYRDDYVSLEVTVAPKEIIIRRIEQGRLDATKVHVQPGESLVVNDGSTGIYRQIVQYLAAKELIKLPEPITPGGGKGDSSFDLPRSQWAEGAEQASVGFDVRLHCPRGIRVSEYTNEYDPDGSATPYIG